VITGGELPPIPIIKTKEPGTVLLMPSAPVTLVHVPMLSYVTARQVVPVAMPTFETHDAMHSSGLLSLAVSIILGLSNPLLQSRV
jgi:hypothetical protein